MRITSLPIQDSIRDLRQIHMGCLVKIVGVVTRRSGVFPQLTICKYNCMRCGYVMGPYSVNGAETNMQGVQCHSCQEKGPYQLNTEQTVYCNYQKLTLQESPGSVPPGRLPRHKDVVLQWDLIDVARPGEEIEITGAPLHPLRTLRPIGAPCRFPPRPIALTPSARHAPISSPPPP